MPPRPKQRKKEQPSLKPAKYLAAIAVLVLGAWWLNQDPPEAQQAAQVVEESSQAAAQALAQASDTTLKAAKKLAKKAAPKAGGLLGYDYDITTAPGFGNPSPVPGQQLVRHPFYTLSYDEPSEQPSWVAYVLKGAYTQGSASRKGLRFVEDLKVKTGSATDADYRASGYDRGHLLPAADMKFDQKAMEQTFLYSNCTPQLHSFNAGVWNELENAVRRWAKREGRVHVVTGPVIGNSEKTVGGNRVVVPSAFYKVVLDADLPERKMIAFLIPHQATDEPYTSFAVPVDVVEEATGLDFFPLVPDPLEDELEASSSLKAWK